MRFIHVADMHLGATPDKSFPWSKERTEQIWETFRDIIDVCRREQTDLLLIAGDLFHKQPLVRELKEADALFASIPGVKVVIIAGNHDYISGVSNYNGFEWSDNVTFFKDEELQSIYFEDINTEVYGLSFCHRQIHEPLLDNAKPAHPDRISILLMHGGEPGNLPVDRKKLLGAGFDYIACGHFHTPNVTDERMRYPGCPEPLEKNDTGALELKPEDADKDYPDSNRWAEPGKTGEHTAIKTEYVVCNKVSYFKEDIEVDRETTQFTLEDMIRDRIAENGDNNIFTFRITGRRDPDITFDTEKALRLGRILDIADMSEPDYDFERLMVENRGNIIGRFIENIKSGQGDDELCEKALNYGITALFGKSTNKTK